MHEVNCGVTPYEHDPNETLYYRRYSMQAQTREANYLRELVASWREKHVIHLANSYETILYANGDPVARLLEYFRNNLFFVDIIYPLTDPSLFIAHQQAVLWQVQKQCIGFP